MNSFRTKVISPIGVIFLAVIQTSALGVNFDPSQEAIEWALSDSGNGHIYEIVILEDIISWDDANQVALSRGGYLVTLKTPEENQFITSAFQFAGSGQSWIGLRQDRRADDYEEPASGWYWVTGEPLGWSNWRANEPGDGGGIGEDWANIWFAGGDVTNPSEFGTWNDNVLFDIHRSDSFIIEWSDDCNNDGLVDYGQILDGTVADIDSNGIPDCCEGGPTCDPDCDGDGTSDADEISNGEAGDVNQNGLPDNCEPDCDGDGTPDFVELESGSFDCNDNTIPDECEIADDSSFDSNSNGIIDACELDCNGNTFFDFLELDLGLVEDCDQNRVPDECDIADGSQSDCNLDGIPDSCVPFDDCDSNGVPDECQVDTDQDGSIDVCDDDDDGDDILDECDVDSFVGPEGAQYWDPAEGGNGHWYKGTAAPGIAWEEAAAQAEALGGYLCTVPSEEENVWVFGNVASDPSLWNTWFGPWIGGYQDTSSPEYSEPDGAWSWVTGEPWSYANWGPGDPSNTNGQDYAAFGGIPGDEIRFTWNDLAPPQPGGFIVEWSGASDCNDNGILDSCEVDTDLDGLPDECDPDIDGDGIPNECDVGQDSSGLNPVAYFPFDSESDLDGWNVNGAGEFYPTVTDHLVLPGEPAHLQLDQQVVPVDGEFTISLWIKNDSSPVNSWRMAFNQIVPGERPIWIGAVRNTGNFRANPWLFDGEPESESYPYLEPGRWYHVAATADWTSDTGSLYLDGELVQSGVFLDTDTQPLEFLVTYLGRQHCCGNEYWTGGIDQILIYDRQLSLAEVQALAVSRTSIGTDCNSNGVLDDCEVDSDDDGAIDECDPDDDNDGVPDECDPDITGGADCDANGVDDLCELGEDCNSNSIPDRCESDLDRDGVIDDCDPDDDGDGVPDECDPRWTGGEDCDANGIDDACEPDLDEDGTIDACDPDIDGDGIPNECDASPGSVQFFYANSKEDFAAEQGSNGWRYRWSSLPSLEDIQDISIYAQPGECSGPSESRWSIFCDQDAYIGATITHPVIQPCVTPVIEYTSPFSGDAFINVFVDDHDGSAGDGTQVRLIVDDQLIDTWVVGNVGEFVDADFTIPVQQFSTIRLAVDSNGCTSQDGDGVMPVLQVSSYPLQTQGAARQWNVEDGGNGHWYVFTMVPRACPQDTYNQFSAIGGYPATVHSEQEDAFIDSLIPNYNGSYSTAYLGGVRNPDVEEGWSWLNGEPWTFTAWSPYNNQPNDSTGYSEKGVAIYSSAHTGAFAGWHDSNICECDECNTANDYAWIIEFSSDCNNDGIVDYGQILDGTFSDEDQNGVLDSCELEDNDCNSNGVLDSCELEDNDCNSNSIPDDCEGFEDCNANGIGDVCDIASGASQDINQDGVPDECQCIADIISDGVVDFQEVLALLNAWGPCGPPCPPDINADGVVSFIDLLRVLDAWGPCDP